MNSVHKLLTSLLFIIFFPVQAEEATSTLSQGYISDDLFIYMHSGAGNNFRILGTINSGDEVKITGLDKNNYTQIIDSKERTAWVESKYVSAKPGLRSIIAELNGKLANISEQGNNLDAQLNQANDEISQLTSQKRKLNNELSALNLEFNKTKSTLKTQDTDIQKEWFYNGAIVLIIGLFLGLLLPRLTQRKQGPMDSWK